MKKKLVITISVIAMLVLSGPILGPIPILPEDELMIAKGSVSQIFEGSESDIIFKLEGNNERFYINRGLEQGLKLNDLKRKLIGRNITIKYPEYWSLLSGRKTHHFSKLEYKGETLFSELAQ